jgi:LacI family transcriptional regulator
MDFRLRHGIPLTFPVHSKMTDVCQKLIDVYHFDLLEPPQGEIMRKPTLMDVAANAGVSYATADRVLNRRGGVAAKSVQRVMTSIEHLGYKRDVTAANLARSRSYDFVFLIPSQAGAFFDELRSAVTRQARTRRNERIDVTLEHVPAFDANALADALEACRGRDLAGVCLVAIDGPRVRAAVDALRAEGVVVLTLVADTQADGRDAYIGLDNHAAGRTAGRLMALSHRLGGTVLPISGSLQAADHAQRYAGFKEVLPANVTVLPVVESYDQPEHVAQAVQLALKIHPNLSGIYSMGAGHSGLITALDEMPKSLSTLRPVVILHDLVPQVRRALTNGLVDAIIDQKPDHQIAMALDTMKSLSDGDPLPASFGAIVPALYLQDNLPPVSTDGPTESPAL